MLFLAFSITYTPYLSPELNSSFLGKDRLSFLQNLWKSQMTTQFQKERWNFGIFTGKSKMQSWLESESKVIKSLELEQGGSGIHGATPYSYIKWCLTFSFDHREITIDFYCSYSV